MKKKMLAVLMAGVLSVSALTACGGDEPAAPAEKTESTETKTEEKPAEKKEESAGITFADLQNNYALLVDAKDAVVELYQNDAIAQDDNVESLLSEADDLIAQMGELTEDQFESEQDMIDMNDAMLNVLDGLQGIVDMMQGADNDSEADTEVETEDAGEVSYVDGFYANDGNGNDFVIAFYEGAAGDVAYVSDGTDEVLAEYTVSEAELDDGTVYYIVSVGNTALGYYEDGDDVYLIDGDSNVYAAAHLSEAEADEIYNAIH
ncbi:MAG: hypothetical protein K6E50_12565 [Lachnospiraceae bacterium]|nr:hypothetical protein [Lachnospiraceae bacterium]